VGFVLKSMLISRVKIWKGKEWGIPADDAVYELQLLYRGVLPAVAREDRMALAGMMAVTVAFQGPSR
jgi:hypothetical protein